MNKFVVYKEYLDLLELIIERYNLCDEDKQKILSHSNQFYTETQLMSFDSTVPTKFSLRVKRTYHPISWESKEGRIFELIGTNSRNKTTTLIYTATLLGIDWDEIAPYIEDSKILRQAKLIRKEISDGIPAYLLIENSRYRYEVDINNSIASALWWDKATESHLSFNDISLATNLDWKEYQSKIGGFFDVQVVGVGRNFITQVGFEEATNLVLFCNEVSNFISGYNQMLLAQKPKMNPTILRAQISELEKKLKELGTELKQINQNLSLTKINLSQAKDDLYKCKDIFVNEEVKNYFSLEQKKQQSEELINQIKILTSKIDQANNLISQYTEAINTSNKNLLLLDEGIFTLKEAYSIIASELDFSNELKDDFLNALNNRDISALSEMSSIFLLDEETQKAHSILSRYSFSGISLSTKLLGLSYFDNTILNLADLKEKMNMAANNACVLCKLNTNYISLLDIMKNTGYDTTEKYNEEISGLEILKGVIQNLKNDLINSITVLSECKSRLPNILSPSTTFKELEAARQLAFQRIDEFIMSDLERIAENNNINCALRMIEVLSEAVIQYEALIQQHNNKRDDIQRYIVGCKQKRKKLLEALESIDENNQIDARVNALTRVKDFLLNVAEYFTYKRKHFESTTVDLNLERNFTNNRNNLGDDFDIIIDMVNNRIKDRCPIAFVNTNNGVEERKVLEYDFLGSDFKVENLEKVSQYHGGITSSMTVYGLATRKTGAEFGSILLVDEWGDVGVYKEYVFDALSKIDHLAMAIFVDVDKNETITKFKVG